MLPKLEAKSVIYKAFANVDAVPIALATQDADEIVEIVRSLAADLRGVLPGEHRRAKCFTIENRIRKAVRVAVLHHEFHAAGIIVLAALLNALEVVGEKGPEEVRIVINGAGLAGIRGTKGLYVAGLQKLVLCDRQELLQLSTGRKG